MEKIWKRAVSSRFPDLVIDLKVSNYGCVEKITTGHLYTPHLKDGYYCIKRNKKTIFIHHLVAETFIEPRPENLVIDHKDGNKHNNKLSNLRYADSYENALKGNSSIDEIPQNLTLTDKVEYLNKKINKMEEKITKLLEQLNINIS